MPEHEGFSEAEAENASQYLQNWTRQLLPFIQRAAKRARLENANDAAAPATAASAQDGEHDDAAARLLMDLATSVGEPSTSASVPEMSQMLHSELTTKGKNRIRGKETRVRPPLSVTKFLAGRWPSIRMPDVRSAMEAEDMVVLYVNRRYPGKLGDSKLAANQDKVLNFRLSHHDTPSVNGSLTKLLSLTNGSSGDGQIGPDDTKLSEVEVLSSFLKDSHTKTARIQMRKGGPQSKRMATEMSLKSNSTNIPFADVASISSIKMNGVVKSGSIIVGLGDKHSTTTAGASLGGTPKSIRSTKPHPKDTIPVGNISKDGTGEKVGVSSLQASQQDDFSFHPAATKDAPATHVGLPGGIHMRPQDVSKPQGTTTVVDRTIYQQSPAQAKRGMVGGSDAQSRRKTAEALFASIMECVDSKAPRGRQAGFDEVVEWCVRVKRALGPERPLTVDAVVNLANIAWAPTKLNASTLRKRIKRKLGISWAQIGTPDDPGHAGGVEEV